MLSFDIPGYGSLKIDHMVLDYNGTLAVDGTLIPGVEEVLNRLSSDLDIYVVTADTFGKAAGGLKDVHCKLTVLDKGNQDEAKAQFVRHLGAAQTVAIGNGRNDAKMLSESRLGIAVILAEGASTVSLNTADIVCTDIVAALELFVHPLRLTATLRA